MLISRATRELSEVLIAIHTHRHDAMSDDAEQLARLCRWAATRDTFDVDKAIEMYHEATKVV